MIETIVCVACAALVLYKTISVMASINILSFDGHPWKFFGLACHWALVGAGSVATALGLSIGGIMLLVGLAMMIITDRRAR